MLTCKLVIPYLGTHLSVLILNCAEQPAAPTNFTDKYRCSALLNVWLHTEVPNEESELKFLSFKVFIEMKQGVQRLCFGYVINCY